MTTATSTRQKTEFLVSQHTSSKEVFDHLTELNEGKGPNTDLPIRAYNEGRKGTTLKIYNKKTSAVGLIKATANPQKVSARVLVIETIGKILKTESEKSSSPEEKKTIDQVLGNIKARKSHCRNHDVKIPDLIDDLSKLIPIWDKSSANDKTVSSTSSASTTPPKKTEHPKEANTEKSKPTKTTEKVKSQAKVAINSTHGKNKSSVQNSKKPKLIIKQADFDLSSAITFLVKIKKHGENFDFESNAKAQIRVGEIKDTGELSFYVSTKTSGKAKKTDRAEEGRKAESKTTTSNRAITILRSIADLLTSQNRLSAEEVNKVFTSIEKQSYISVNDASILLNLLETGRREVHVLPSLVQADSTDTSDAPSIVTINANPFEVSSPGSTSLSSNVISTNQFEDTPTQEPQTSIPAPLTFLQRVSDYFKPVTNFLASIRRFFGFN